MQQAGRDYGVLRNVPGQDLHEAETGMVVQGRKYNTAGYEACKEKENRLNQ